MKQILYLIIIIINTSIYAQDTLRFSGEFIVPFDVFKVSSNGKIKNLNVEFSDLHLNYFILNSEFESSINVDNIFITRNLIQNIFLKDVLLERRSNDVLKVKGDSICLNLNCYINYSFEKKTNRYWRKINQGENLIFTKFYCEFTCVKLGKHEVRLVSPLARCKNRAFKRNIVDVYLISSIRKIIPIEK